MIHDNKLANLLAVSAASLFLSACNKGSAETTSPSDAATAAGGGGDEVVKCLGINECKGQSLCDTATTACAGQNECKGKGWIKVPKSECDEKGGTLKT